MIASLLIATIVAAGSPQPSPSPLAGNTWCPVGVSVVPLDSSRIAIGFWTPMPTGRASGVVTLFTSGARYDVRFDDTTVLHSGRVGRTRPAIDPIVLRFPAPVHIESAAVTSLDAPTPGPCNPLYAPWTGNPPSSDTFDATVGVRAAYVTARNAPEPVPYTPPQCATRFESPKTIDAYEPRAAVRFNGVVDVLVTVGTDGRAIAVETLKPSGNGAADAVAKDAAARSRYSPQIFNCEKIVGTYLFRVEFSAR